MFLKRVSLFIFLTLSLNLVVAAAYAQSTALLNSLSVANAKEVMYDSFGNIYLIANYEENSTINNTLLTSYGAKDILIAKFSAMGALIWKQNFGGSIDDEVCSFQFDAHQNLYVCGTFQKSMILKVANSTKKIKSKGGLDGFLMQLNAESGSINWITTLGTIQDDKTYSLTLDPADGVLISGASISISGSVHEVNLYRFSQKDGSLLTNRTVFKTTSLEIANSTNCIVANSYEKALYICVPYTSKITLLNDSQKPIIAAESEANLLIEKCDLNLNAIWHATIEGYQSKSITKHALALKNNCLLVSFFSVGFCNYNNGLNRPLICDYPFNSALLILNTETSNLLQKQVTEEFTQVCKNNFFELDSITLLCYKTANKFLTIQAVDDNLQLSPLTKIPVIDLDVKSICCNYFTNELTLLFDYSKSMTLAGVPFTCTGITNAALLKLKLSKYEIWKPYEVAPTTKISNEDYSLDYFNNKSQSLITIEYVNAEEKHINSGIYDFRGRIVKQLANDLQTKGTKQIYTSMNDLPLGLYLFELNGRRKDILHY